MLIGLHPTNTRGSEWRRWDPHIHAPGTLSADRFEGDWDAYCDAIETRQPAAEALGITDYMCFETYRTARQLRAAGRMANIKLMFPNIEMRLDVKTERGAGINIHLLFSPHDPDHEQQITRVLAQLIFKYHGSTYVCSPSDLQRLGRDFHDDHNLPNDAALRIGASQFKINFDNLRALFSDNAWMRTNCLVAVAGGSKDGTAALQKDGSFAATRQEIESFAHIIFSATPSQREFWLGNTKSSSPEFIKKTYGSLKPCLHGSDAHSVQAVLAPADNKICWLKGDATFDTLRQAVIEPEARVWLGPSPPAGAQDSYCIDSIRVEHSGWLHDPVVALNPGMIAVIGARGSGKTALADMLATGAGCGAESMGESSFLHRASFPRDLLGDASVTLRWADRSISDSRRLCLREAGDPPSAVEVSYLSQHFVETLCSSSGLATQLRAEIERVIYEATPRTERLEADSFEELRSIALHPIRCDREDAIATVRAISARITAEEIERDQLPLLIEQRKKLEETLVKQRAQLSMLVPKNQEEIARKLTEANLWVSRSESRVEAIMRRIHALRDLKSRITQFRMVKEPQSLSLLKSEFVNAGITDQEWLMFRMDYVGDVDAVILNGQRQSEKLHQQATTGEAGPNLDSSTPRADWPLAHLKAYRDRLQNEFSGDVQRQKQYVELQRIIRDGEQQNDRMSQRIVHLESAHERIRAARPQRRAASIAAFDTILREEEVLRRLYAPLAHVLAAASGSLAKLRFDVSRSVDVKSWADKGELLFDLRYSSSVKGRGTIHELANLHLVSAWSTGDSTVVADAMEQFIENVWDEIGHARPKKDKTAEWKQLVADWLFDVQHIEVQYTMSYDCVAIEQLSPGTRGIVLLLLYLAIDNTDRRPLIIDQPEENLDPRSVFEELVPHFKQARKRRQIIIVTHNANLVVNTDVDQVIYASSEHRDDNSLPTICYASGSLESLEVRNIVCMTLEGGEEAFRERERRYRLR